MYIFQVYQPPPIRQAFAPFFDKLRQLFFKLRFGKDKAISTSVLKPNSFFREKYENIISKASTRTKYPDKMNM